MNKRLKSALVCCAFLPLCTESSAHSSSTYTIFDFPGARATAGRAINSSGAVGGSSFGDVKTGFIREPDGTFKSFACASGRTYVNSMNDSEIVVGYCESQHGSPQPYIREADGILTVFAVGDTADATSVNKKGSIAGYYYTSSDALVHSFLRKPNGKIIEFDPPDAAGGSYALKINDDGDIVGTYQDSTELNHGYIRDARGQFTTVDDPDASKQPDQGTVAVSINSTGSVAGYYVGTDDQWHGFVRASDGTTTSFDACTYGTFPVDINSDGNVTGSCDHVEGFVRSADGTITTFNACGEATDPAALNDGGQIVGLCYDKPRRANGFVSTP